MRTSKRWTRQEEERLLRQVNTFPQNKHKCFMIVSEVTGRTPKAVEAHWYAKVCKEQSFCFFSKTEVMQKPKPSLWQRIKSLIRWK